MTMVQAKHLLQAMKLAGSVVERRNTIPILSNLEMDAADGQLRVSGTDLDIEVQATVPCEQRLIRGAFGHPQGIAALVKAGGAESVLFEQVEKTSADWQIKCGDMALNTATMKADDFPHVSPPHARWTASIGSEAISLLRRVSMAMSTEETRYYLNGVYLHHVADWTYVLVATDGHRLIKATIELPDADPGIVVGLAAGGKGSLGGCIIPKKTVKAILALKPGKDPLRLTLGEPRIDNEPAPTIDKSGLVRFQADTKIGDVDVRIISKLIDGTFPDYARVIPDRTKPDMRRAKVKTADVRRALGGLIGFVTERTKAIKLNFDGGSLAMTVNSPEDGQARVSIPAECSEPFGVGFNGRYLMDMALATAGEHMLLESTDAFSPCVITDPDATDLITILMPMRV